MGSKRYSILRAVFVRATLVVLLTGVAHRLPAQEPYPLAAVNVLPDAPLPQVTPGAPSPTPATPPQLGTHAVSASKGCLPTEAATRPSAPIQGSSALSNPLEKSAAAGCPAKFDIFYPLGKPPAKGRLTSMDKLRIATSNVVDPFNLTTIGFSAAITVGSDPNTPYGPGMKGWAKNSGTLLTEDMTGGFFVTYLVPSLVKQDPRYYRMPKASIPRRIANAVVHPVWTRSDDGGHMPNYADLLGIPATIALANVYVPGRKQGFGSVAESSAIAIASAPIDSLTTEFLPDVAKHFKIRIVLIQQIVNHIAITGGPE